MKKLIILSGITSTSLMGCSKGGPKTPTPVTPSFYATASHHGIVSNIKDTIGCSLNGTVFIGGGTAYANIECLNSAYSNSGFSSKLSAVPINRSSPLGVFFIASDKTGLYSTFSYLNNGIQKIIGVQENSDSTSKLTITSIDSEAIVGSAYLKLKDGSIADIEFRVRNTQ